MPTFVLLVLISSFAFAESEIDAADNLARGNFHNAVFSRDAQVLLTATGRIAQLWDVEAGTLIRQFEGHNASIHSICFGPKEKRILTGAGNAGAVGRDDATARIWDIETGKQLAVLGGDHFKSYVPWARFSGDGERVLVLSVDMTSSRGNVVVSWDVASRKQGFIIPGISVWSNATNRLVAVKLSPRGEMLVGLTSESRRICMWDSRTGELVWQFAGESRGSKSENPNSFGSVRFGPNGKILLGVCIDRTAKTWSTGMGHELQVFAGHEAEICAAEFCNQGERVMTASKDATARLWESHSGRQIKRYDHAGPIYEMVVSRNGRRMATMWSQPKKDTVDRRRKCGISLWDVNNARELKRFDPMPDGMQQFVFSPDSKRMLVTRKNAALILDAVTGETLRVFDSTKEIRSRHANEP